MEKQIENEVFSKGEKIENEYFTGDAWLNMLVQDTKGEFIPIGNVTFAPSARNNWHRHPGGQILLCTAGKGYYQEAGKQVKKLEEGDVVTIGAGVKHWHGAQKDTYFTHIAIDNDFRAGIVEWLEQVTQEEYEKLEETK